MKLEETGRTQRDESGAHLRYKVHTKHGRLGGSMKVVLAVLLVLTFAGTPGWASLGEHEASVSLDQQVMRGELRATTQDGYSVQQITAMDGMVVKEFVSPAGMVFGVSWQGPTMPNLQQLLGSYFTQFQEASQSRTRHRGPMVLRTDKLVVESGGHMRAFHGRAYVPELMPKGVTAEVVR
jgi:Protein of unknown function (DUF2844)